MANTYSQITIHLIFAVKNRDYLLQSDFRDEIFMYISGIFKNLKSEIVEQLEKFGLIQKMPGHTTKYTLTEDYHQLVNDGLKIGKRYIAKEVELLLLALQGNQLKIGALEEILTENLTRSQIKYLLNKLMDDNLVKVEGQLRGSRYSITDPFTDLRGDVLISAAITELRTKYESI